MEDKIENILIYETFSLIRQQNGNLSHGRKNHNTFKETTFSSMTLSLQLNYEMENVIINDIIFYIKQ